MKALLVLEDAAAGSWVARWLRQGPLESTDFQAGVSSLFSPDFVSHSKAGALRWAREAADGAPVLVQDRMLT